MAETALNETRHYPHLAVPLAPQPPGSRVSVAARVSGPIPAPAPPPEAQLARMWLAALAVAGDEPAGAGTDIPMDMPTARSFLTRQSAALVSILLGSPFRPRLAALLAAAARAGATRVGEEDMEQRVAAVTEALANGYVRALRDRTLEEQESIRRAELDAQRIISDQLRHQALHDPLTGLPNRAAAFDRLSAALETGSSGRIGLCYLDLDGFKAVNDRYGHDAGDELLVNVADRIATAARDADALAARIGGDEFIVLADPSPGERGMIALAAAILGELRRPVSLRIGWVGISACAGVVECAAGSPAAATMVADADAALYLAKSRGPGRWAVFDSARQPGLRFAPGRGWPAPIRRG